MSQPDLRFVTNDNREQITKEAEEFVKPKLVKIKVPDASPDPEAS